MENIKVYQRVSYIIVSGPPGAGKNTYVEAVLKIGGDGRDLVIDMDEIKEGLGFSRSESSSLVVGEAIAERDRLLNSVHENGFDRVFIIACLSSPLELSRWISHFRASSVRIVPTIDEIRSRDISGFRKNLAEDWFAEREKFSFLTGPDGYPIQMPLGM